MMEQSSRPDEISVAAPEPAEPPSSEKSGDKPARRAGGIALRALCLLLETLLLLAAAVYGLMFVLTKGPSDTAGRLFVRSVRETSAIGFLAGWFYSEDEIQGILAVPEDMVFEETDTALIRVGAQKGADGPDAWGLTDKDGDGIIVEPVKGSGFSGYMMVVLDPSRVIVAADPGSFGGRGYTVEEFVDRFDAVAGVNGGAFDDPNGEGNGSSPDGLVIFEGKTYNSGVKQGFAGIDENHILHVGCRNSAEAVEAGIQYGTSFGPVLLQNGQMTDSDTLESGVNPRTAVGQRSDGAFLLLVIDGRQVISLGATYLDEAEIMLEYGAVNAINMDGGSSSMMWYGDGYVNNCASVIGIRPIPTAFVVLKQDGDERHE